MHYDYFPEALAIPTVTVRIVVEKNPYLHLYVVADKKRKFCKVVLR
jgi:hypothetical protein